MSKENLNVCECGNTLEIIRLDDILPSFKYTYFKQCTKCRTKHFSDGWEEGRKSFNNAFTKEFNPLIGVEIDWVAIEKAWLKKKKEDILCYLKKIKDMIRYYLTPSKS